MNDTPQVLGVYSMEHETLIGTGHTSRTHVAVTYWFAKMQDADHVAVQPLNLQHVPSGALQEMSKEDFMDMYKPEPFYYKTHTVPALKTLQRKIEMGCDAMKVGDLDAAERQFLKALMVDDKNIDANMRLGEVYSEMGDVKNLRKVLNNLMCIDEAFTQKHREKFNQFGISMRKNGHFDEAIGYYNKALEFTDKDEHLHFNLARVHYDRGAVNPCIACLEKALTLNPNFNIAHKFLTYCVKKVDGGTCPGDDILDAASKKS